MLCISNRDSSYCFISLFSSVKFHTCINEALMNIGESVSIDCCTDKNRTTTFFGTALHFIVEDGKCLKLNEW